MVSPAFLYPCHSPPVPPPLISSDLPPPQPLFRPNSTTQLLPPPPECGAPELSLSTTRDSKVSATEPESKEARAPGWMGADPKVPDNSREVEGKRKQLEGQKSDSEKKIALDQYEAWKGECQKMVPCIGDDNGATSNIETVFAKKVTQWKRSLHQVGLNVIHTDRALVFYESEANNQAKLWNVLGVYAWVDNAIGYVQGMNDICSPMVILMENEADAFRCFERAMRRLPFELVRFEYSVMLISITDNEGYDCVLCFNRSE
ncbi:hypothetical protein RHGRI_035868 [Rhododendron griersonianum]|uniref:Rab-GAP TBC domain-containing protein n=1 Tax=Rhododendron griersonianum TaxID=479676 RepID=A0AAV6HPZ2_9ERIC|nr:hypothetical protein RHGRI_035868 [Rhododendron griersonianum]